MQKIYRSLTILAVVAALIAIIACAPAAQPTAQPPTAAPQPTAVPAQPTAVPQPTTAPAPTQAPVGAKDTLVWARDISDVVSFDPAQAYEYGDILADHSIYDTLVKFEGADLTTLKPDLATKWDVKDTGSNWTITFTLADGVKFASGNPFTADDVVFSIQRVIRLNKPPAFLMTDVGKLTVDSIKATDPKTVVFTMPKDVSPTAFLTVLTGVTGGIVDSKLVKTHDTGGDLGNAWLLDHSAGSGPYVLDHWTKDVEYLLKANPNAAIQPKTPNILIKHVGDSSVQQALLEKGDADIANDLSPEQLTALKTNKDIQEIKAGNLLIYYLAMNVKVPPLDKPEVREAIRTVIDYDGIVNDMLSGNAIKNQAIVPVGLFGSMSATPFQKDVTAAKALLAKAGVPNGFTINLDTYTGAGGIVQWGDLATKIQADLAEVGITAKVSQRPAAELLADYRAQKTQIVVLAWGPDFPDPDANGTPFTTYAAKSIGWRNAWDDPKAADLAKTASLETDPTKRAADYATLNDYVAHNGPYAVLFQPTNLFALRSNVQGFLWSPIGYGDLWTISK